MSSIAVRSRHTQVFPEPKVLHQTQGTLNPKPYTKLWPRSLLSLIDVLTTTAIRIYTPFTIQTSTQDLQPLRNSKLQMAEAPKP